MLADLAADRAHVAALEVEILQLQGRIRELEAEKTRTQDRLDRYCYPVLTLPNEITSEIFVHFLPAFPLHPRRDSPTVLAQICRKWREITLGTPTLWTAIYPTFSYTPFRPPLKIVDLWLSRSRSCALSVEIIDPHEDNVLPRILAEAARLKDLILDTYELPAGSCPMPLLQRLELRLDPNCRQSDIALFSDTPQLRTVVLNDFAALNVQLPWAQLTSVELTFVSPSEFASVWRQTPNLLHCELKLHLDGSALTELRLPLLESLIFRNGGSLTGTARIAVLSTLTLPALRSLSIPEAYLGETPIDTLTQFITKSGCTIRKLCVRGMGDIQVSRLYRRAFPQISKFTFKDVYGFPLSEDGESEDP
ncbi:hypothetical protein C8R46DRAFT_1358654 [Mycena filopes]|nr:hypothetical protein C8R46DRAFT_1358654 [Mycena filopes]